MKMKMAHNRREAKFSSCCSLSYKYKTTPFTNKGSIDISLIYERKEGSAQGITMDGKEV